MKGKFLASNKRPPRSWIALKLDTAPSNVKDVTVTPL